ncbi:GAP domain, ANK repeat and PH domain-containing protein 2 [Seminavis robusta]|uniref:GAP domain, ANK repeat and PH domain-containing protein 2 n=1 Tax=Seminavis robusta TaxID=568900 RepID=A0A9N8DYK5_9STRA|nr:GAP domain, ANK repeat and PH domain-containing protein 2 [Seminavis robusta]|eukprot:Sro380_g130620.1 GAP domain, ANK repeat and PH domain-containing protein 2 (247) ;mRNA; r:20644-21384
MLPSSSSLSPEMQSRMESILLSRANQTCADCPASNPEWVSFIHERSRRTLGVLCCSQCAQHHHFELGDKRCHIKYLKMTHEWAIVDIQTLENTGNAFVNATYEANLTSFDKTFVHPSEEVECTRRAKFIKNKYKKRKFRKAESFDSATQRMAHAHSPIRRRATAPGREVAEMLSLSEVEEDTSLKRTNTSGHLSLRAAVNGKRLAVVHSPKRDMRNRRLSKITASGMIMIALPSDTRGRQSYNQAA